MSFHLFHKTEVYSNADESVQSIELASEATTQQLWADHKLEVTQGVTVHSQKRSLPR